MYSDRERERERERECERDIILPIIGGVQLVSALGAVGEEGFEDDNNLHATRAETDMAAPAHAAARRGGNVFGVGSDILFDTMCLAEPIHT